jgi:hypothetical protein
MIGFAKNLSKKESVRGVLCWLAAQYIRVAHLTGRWQVVGREIPEAFWTQGKPFILAFWHGRILMMPYCWPPAQTIHMLISQHRDGQIIARTVSHFGIDTIVGSSSKGGSAALRTMLRTLKAGDCVGITPDGPRGPRMRASEGIIQVARMAGIPIIPCTYSARRGRLLGSWDRFMIAWPFSSGIFMWGQPIAVPARMSAEEQETLRQAVEDGLNALSAEADTRMGRPPVAPAPALQAGRGVAEERTA